MIFRKKICFLFFASINCLFDTLQFSLIPETASHLFEKQISSVFNIPELIY